MDMSIDINSLDINSLFQAAQRLRAVVRSPQPPCQR